MSTAELHERVCAPFNGAASTVRSAGDDGHGLQLGQELGWASTDTIATVIRGGWAPSHTWLEVEGRWQQRTNDHPTSETQLLLAESIRVIEQPSPPYKSGFPF